MASAASDASRAEIGSALRRLREDGLVAFPTETVWGLAARARSDAALCALRDWKGRDAGQPVSVLVADARAALALGIRTTPAVRRLMDAFWPGPLTLVLSGVTDLAQGIARADGAVGIRCSTHPVAARLARAAFDAGIGPVTATSLNRHGEAPATSEATARALCAGGSGAPLVLGARDDARCGGPPSTVLDCTTDPPRILRRGALSAAALFEGAGVEVADEQAGTDTVRGEDRA